jgi:hypothetical protein
VAIIPRANPAAVQTDLVGINARNESRISNAGVEAANATTRAVTQGLGAFAQVAQREADKADVVATMESQRKLADWINQQEDPRNPNAIPNVKGRDALKLPDTLLPNYDKAVAEFEAGLPSRRAKEQFRLHAQTQRQQFQSRITRYAVGENEQYQNAERKAFDASAGINAASAYLAGDEVGAARLREDALNMIYADEAAQGNPPTAARLRVQVFESGVHASIVNRLLVTDPIRAKSYLEEHGEGILPDTRTDLLDKVQTYADDAEAEAAADIAFQGSPGGDVQGRLGSLGKQYGFPTTSGIRSQAENDALPGSVKNSQHVSGTAMDFSVRGKSPEQVQAFANALRTEGFEVITKDHGTGPHVHAELPPGVSPNKAPPATLGEAIARLESDPRVAGDPRKRKAAEAKLRSRWQVMEADKIDARNAASERANYAIETADPAQSLRQILGADFEAMAREGKIDAYERRLAERRQGGAARASNPTVLAAMEEGIYRARAGGEAAQAALRAMNPYDPTLDLAPSDRKRLAEAKLDLLSGDASRVAKAASEGEVTGLIVQYRRIQLGLPDADIKKSPEKMAKAVEFEQSMRTWRAQFAQANGREPTYLEVRKQADVLTLSALKFEVPGRVFGTNTETVAALDIPPAMQALIVEALQAEGQPVTGQNVATKWRAYLRQQATR